MNHKIRQITPAGVVTTFAGSGAASSTDGTGTAASFNAPNGLAFDRAGNLYVAEQIGNRIRRITPAGVVTTFAGSGTQVSTDGTGTAASFNTPYFLAFDSAGNLFVGESSGRKIRKITPAGVVTTFAGTGDMGSTDGTGTAASFAWPCAFMLDSADNIYLTDWSNHKLRKLTPDAVVTTFAGSGVVGNATGPTTGPVLNGPSGISQDSSGAFVIIEWTGSRISKITPAGSGALSLAWTAPASNGGSAITDYLVEYRTSPSGPWTTFNDGVSTATSTTITGLVNGTAHDVRISAINVAGTGTVSSSVTAMPGIAPDAPTGLSLTAGNGQLSASWTAPANTGGSPINDYAIEYRFSPSGPWTVFADGISTATTATITGLGAGSTFDVRIRAANSFDVGSASASATSTTTGWTPSAIGANLSFWLDASDASSITLNGSKVSSWQDKSGNGRHATQSNDTLRPSYTSVGLNGRPVVTFNGSSTILLTSAFAMGQSAASVAQRSTYTAPVAQLGTSADDANRGFWGSVGGYTTHQRYALNGAALANFSGQTNLAFGSPAIVSQETALITGSNVLNLGYGTPSYTYLSGYVSEIVITTTALSTEDLQRLEGYLAHKWGLTANLPVSHPYKTTPP